MTEAAGTGGSPRPAGRVGRAHGLDGSFYVESPAAELGEGTAVTVGERPSVVERRAGTDDRPLIRVRGVDDREAAVALRGEPLLVAAGESLEEGEYRVADLVGCEIPGIGTVRRVLSGPSCDVLEAGDGEVLVPFVSDAIRGVDVGAGVIEVDHAFLGTGGDAAGPGPGGGEVRP